MESNLILLCLFQGICIIALAYRIRILNERGTFKFKSPIVESHIDKIEELTNQLLKGLDGLTRDELTSLLDMSTAGWWCWNIETGYDYLSKGWCSQLGYKQDELRHHVSTWTTLMHPDDMKKAEAAMDRHLKSRRPYRLTARYKHKNGHWVTLNDIGKVIRFKGGRPLMMVGHESKAGKP